MIRSGICLMQPRNISTPVILRWIAVALTVATATLGACSKADTPAAATTAPVPVHFVTVEPRTVPVRLTVPGQIEGSKEVEVRARVSGILQRQLYKEGDAVRQDAPLFQIDRAPYEVALAQAKGQFAQATAQADQTRREEARLKPLVDERAVSRKEYDDAASARQLAEAMLQQATAAVRQADLNLSYTSVTAPVAGISGRAQHSVGHADHHRFRRQSAHDDQPALADLGALQPRRIGSGQDSGRSHRPRRSARSSASLRRRDALSR